MARTALLEWEGREYDHNPKSADWYWALGILSVAGAVASLLFGNILLALLIIIATIVLALHAAKEPPLHRFQLVEEGIRVGEELHSFDRMVSFSVLEDVENEYPPMISIKTESWLSPHLIIPLSGVNPDAVYAYFLEHVEEDEHPHTFTDLVAGWLGF
jgi:hypothetical protein